MGTFSYCSDPAEASTNSVEDYYVYYNETAGYPVGGQGDCEDLEFEWKNPDWNFDSFGHALESVFIVFTFNGWQKIMFSAVNAR